MSFVFLNVPILFQTVVFLHLFK